MNRQDKTLRAGPSLLGNLCQNLIWRPSLLHFCVLLNQITQSRPRAMSRYKRRDTVHALQHTYIFLTNLTGRESQTLSADKPGGGSPAVRNNCDASKTECRQPQIIATLHKVKQSAMKKCIRAAFGLSFFIITVFKIAACLNLSCLSA